MSNQQPTASEFEDRKRKLQELRDAGIQPYPERYERTHTVKEMREQGEKEAPRELELILKNPKTEISICGRLMLMRAHGKLTFAQLRDHTGQGHGGFGCAVGAGKPA